MGCTFGSFLVQFRPKLSRLSLIFVILLETMVLLRKVEGNPMKKIVITLAAALALGAPLKALAQDQQPDGAPILVQDQQGDPDAELLIKKKKKHQQEQSQQPSDEQGEQ